ncbi:MAG: aspartyl/asparaginyl beta-hydroxylase domain-containing protein, partial [Endozoicomonas sp.]
MNTSHFPELKALRDNWQVIRSEAITLHEQSHIKASDRLDDIGFNSFFKTGWKRFYLKWYGNDLPSAQALCPETVAMLQKIPGIKAAMFAMLSPDSRLVRHRDPYAGSLRYHLGLITPNSDQC